MTGWQIISPILRFCNMTILQKLDIFILYTDEDWASVLFLANSYFHKHYSKKNGVHSIQYGMNYKVLFRANLQQKYCESVTWFACFLGMVEYRRGLHHDSSGFWTGLLWTYTPSSRQWTQKNRHEWILTQTNIYTHRHTHRQRQTDRHTQTHTETHTHTHTHTDAHAHTPIYTDIHIHPSHPHPHRNGLVVLLAYKKVSPRVGNIPLYVSNLNLIYFVFC